MYTVRRHRVYTEDGMKRITVREFRANMAAQTEPVEVGTSGVWIPMAAFGAFVNRQVNAGIQYVISGDGIDPGVHVPPQGREIVTDPTEVARVSLREAQAKRDAILRGLSKPKH